MTLFADIGDWEEDQRIKMIGEAVMGKQLTAAFIVDDDEKADRYIKKLEAEFPGIRMVSRGAGPIAGTVYVKLAPPLN